MSNYNKILNNLKKAREHIALTAGIGEGKYIDILSDTIDFVIKMKEDFCNSLECSYNDCKNCDYNEA